MVMAGSFFAQLALNDPMAAAQMEAMPRHDPIPRRRAIRASSSASTAPGSATRG